MLSNATRASQVTEWTYDNANRMTRQDNANGTYAIYTYDSRNRPTVIDHMKSDTVTRIAREQTTYDDASNVTQKIIAGITTNYDYDDIDQLTQEAVVSGTTTNYTYDANGNRATRAVGGTTEVYNVDDADKLTSVTVGGIPIKSYHYDPNGNTDQITTSAGTTYLDYDYENRVSQITYPGLTTNTFTYNGLDTRVGKVDSSGTSTYRRDGLGVTAPVLNDGTIAYTPGLSTHTSTQDRFNHIDRMGSNVRQTNPSEGVTSNVTYDAFGNQTSSSGTLVGRSAFGASVGYEYDSGSGFMLLGSRYYDASTGRFASRDSIYDGSNWYAYCGNNPLRYVDATGNARVDIYYRTVVGIGPTSSDQNHTGIVVTDNDPTSPSFGRKYWIEGNPSKSPPPFGHIRLDDKYGTPEGKRWRTIQNDDTPFATVVGRLVKAKRAIEGQPKVGYNPLGPNSNTVARKLIRIVFLTDPYINGNDPSFPGWNSPDPWPKLK